MSDQHKHYMKLALGLARRGLGKVAPNPAVGCLVVRDGVIVGRGWTQLGGRPHAETVALQQAGPAAKEATAYVTLEPCAHYGKTPPCAEALVKAGIAKVVAAVSDEDKRVDGKGFSILRNAGVEVIEGVLEDEARAVNSGFFSKVINGYPVFSLKSATTLDGRIAAFSGDSKWITGPDARRLGHMLRAQHDAILVGVNTVLTDDPSLDCRLGGMEDRSPAVIVLDSTLKTPSTARLFQGAVKCQPCIICNSDHADSPKAHALQKSGAEVIGVNNTRDIVEVAKVLGNKGLTRVFVEGGGQIIASFLKAGMFENFYHFQAGKVIGGDGLPAVGKMGLAQVADAPHLTLKEVRRVGADLLATYCKAE